MSFTDLASLAQARRQQPQPQPPQQQQQAQYDPTAPPDPASFTQQPTNPTAAAEMQVASLDASGGGVPAGLESDADLGDIGKTKDKSATATGEEPAPAESNETVLKNAYAAEGDNAYPPVVFPPNVYRPPQTPRGPGGWGTDWPPLKLAQLYPTVAPSGELPSPMEGYEEMGRTGLYFSNNGPSSIGGLAAQAGFLMRPIKALGDLLSQGKFSPTFDAASLRRLQAQREEGLQLAELAAREHTRYMSGWATLFAGINPDRPAMNLREFREQADQYLRVWGDEKGRVILNNYGPKALEDYLNEQENFRLRLLGAHQQVRKAAGPDQEQQDFDALGGKSGTSAAPEGTGPLQFKVPGGGPEAPVTPTKDASGATATTAEPLNDYETEITANLRDAKGNPLTPTMKANVLRAARDQIESNPQAIPVDPKGLAGTAIGQVRNALQANIDRVAKMRPSPGEDPDEFRQKQLESIRQNVPGEAQLVDDLKSLRIDPQTLTTAGGNRKRAVELTAQIYNAPQGQPGHWDQGMYHQYQTVWANDQSRINLGLGAINRAGTELKNYFAAVNRLPGGEDDPIPRNFMNMLLAQKGTGDAYFADVNEPLRTLATDEVVINNMGGRAAVTPVNQLLAHAQLYSSKRQLRALGHQIAAQLDQIVAYTIDTYHKSTGLEGLPPGVDEERLPYIDASARMNANTGKFPSDAPLELRSIEPKTPSKRLTKEQTWPPMTREQYEARRGAILQMERDDPNNPKLEIWKKEFGLVQ